ncbi:hypothetical protein PG994_010288 [Apiospora phragmitis]|uniref:CFEM domain-containing protein n=1 Tax=Apiospora phragmitis TaxID=2905665 RepID=A0ABR1TS51_9PEZI
MVIPRQRWLPLALAFVSIWSAQPQASAAGLLSLPFCAANCVQKSSTCRATDTRCLCEAVRENDAFLPAVAICIRDECESALSLGTLLIPLRTSCLLLGMPIPNSAIRNGNAALKGPVSSSSTTSGASTTAKATATTAARGTTTTAKDEPSAVPQPPPLASTTTTSSSSTTTAAATTTAATSIPPEQTPETSLTTSTRVTPSNSPIVDGSKGDTKPPELPTDPFAAPVEKGAGSRSRRQAPLFTSALFSSATAMLLVFAWS